VGLSGHPRFLFFFFLSETNVQFEEVLHLENRHIISVLKQYKDTGSSQKSSAHKLHSLQDYSDTEVMPA
jgi:hypothetical protein